jgi:hypothetical protein
MRLKIPDYIDPRADYFLSAPLWQKGGIELRGDIVPVPLVCHASVPYLPEPTLWLNFFWMKQKGSLCQGTVELMKGVSFYAQ